LETSLVTWTFGGDATVLADYALTTTTMAVIIASTHFAYPLRDDQAELAWVADYIQRWFTRFEDGHPSEY